MTTKLDEAANQDFKAELSEWIEAFDDVVAQDWEQGAALLSALRQRAREAESRRFDDGRSRRAKRRKAGTQRDPLYPNHPK